MSDKYDVLPERIRWKQVCELAAPLADDLLHSLGDLEEAHPELTFEEIITVIKEVAQIVLVEYYDDPDFHGVPEEQIPAAERYHMLVIEQLNLF